MTKKEMAEISECLLSVYSGILFNHSEFESENNGHISYRFDCPEFEELREKYDLESIAGNSGDFQKAKKLLHWLAPKLTHRAWYDNHIECNSLALLEYSFDNPAHGINCLNKSKIFEECCLALGIYARRVVIMPFSPYDFDNHVVCEIYDRKMGKWIMLDPTTDGYFVDENKTPLSLLEMRERFANDSFVTFVLCTDRLNDLNRLKSKHADKNFYICKNLFYFKLSQVSCFGECDDWLIFCPKNYSTKNNRVANMKYRINHMPEENSEFIPKYEKTLDKMKDLKEPQKTDINVMKKAPISL